MKTQTFKKPLAYYTNKLLIEEMNKIKPVQDQKQKETIHGKIIKVVETVSLAASVFVLCCSIYIVLTEFIKLFS